MKIAFLVAATVGLSVLVVGCAEGVIRNDPDKTGTTITVGGADKSKPWLIMACKPQADGTFSFTVEGDGGSVQLSAPPRGGALTIDSDGKLSAYTLSEVKKEELVTYAYRLANGASQRVNFKGCTRQ